MRKVLAAVAVAAGVFLLAGGGEALAAHCFPANKPDGAGNIGDVIVNLATGQVTEPTNPGGRTAGGFAESGWTLTGMARATSRSLMMSSY